MEKIILNNKAELEVKEFTGTTIILENKTIEELEQLFTKENLIKIEVKQENGDVTGIYNNLECISITKNLEDNTIIVNLRQLDALKLELEQLKETVDTLVLSGLEG